MERNFLSEKVVNRRGALMAGFSVAYFVGVMTAEPARQVLNEVTYPIGVALSDVSKAISLETDKFSRTVRPAPKK